MTDRHPDNRVPRSASQESRIEEICARFDAACKSKQRPCIQDYARDWTDPDLSLLLYKLLVTELRHRVQQGETPARGDYAAAFPKHDSMIELAFSEVRIAPVEGPPAADLRHVDLSETSLQEDVASHQTPPDDEPPPARFGRYRVLRKLGVGGFGTVYLGSDDQLMRRVAIKVPRRDRVHGLESFLTEAQILASLDHPNIVDVYDVGQLEDGHCYVVSEWIEGSDLAQFAQPQRLPYRQSAELTAKIADALRYAHSQKLVHRDVKPANILMDKSGEPYLTDFGLALSEGDFGREFSSGGTPAYMSPEQARGEGHLVDGRSDIFSLGAVFYFLLTGERPFAGSSRIEVMERIKVQLARPPRQLVPDVPRELERICLKALSRHAADRYTTALDMADDLRHFLAEQDPQRSSQLTSQQHDDPQRSAEQTRVIPKGLRSFDRLDADFFLQLLPGPRDRHGLPDSIRFWTTRIEEGDADETFRVGLIYGSSGCGKSSLVKAGLLPRLANHVETIHVECTGADEERLLRRLRKRFGDLDPKLNLSDSLAAIRRGCGMKAGNKLLIVLDHFEQWLNASRAQEHAELIDALRQCDGERLQAIILARDDFWMAVTRFMLSVQEPVIEGHNSAAVRLFDPLHARKVLAEFGRSFGCLPDDLSNLSPAQTSFLQQAVSELTRNGEIIPVRLTLFAEMIKSKDWTPSTLKQYGGTEGLTIRFLDESFSSKTAPPGRRIHQDAAREVLRALLPEGGADITGHMRSHDELLEISNYSDRPQLFADLMRILDNETRLISPVEPVDEVEPTSEPAKFYHLTHDHLVAPLREWLTRKQKETYRGRAELRMAAREKLWTAQPENRHLPRWWECVLISCLTSRRSWTEPQTKMMRAARKSILVRGLIYCAIMLPILAIATASYRNWQWQSRRRTAEELVVALAGARTTEVPEAIQRIADRRYLPLALPMLDNILRDAPPDSVDRLNASLAVTELSHADDAESSYLVHYLLHSATATEAEIISRALADHMPVDRTQFWQLLEQPQVGEENERLRAACALAIWEPESERWTAEVRGEAALRLVSAPLLASWMESLDPVIGRLIEPLNTIFHDRSFRGEELTALQRSLAAHVLASFALNHPEDLTRLLANSKIQQLSTLNSRDGLSDQEQQLGFLVNLLVQADAQQFRVLFGFLSRHAEVAAEMLTQYLDQLGQRQERKHDPGVVVQQMNTAISLMRLGRPQFAWQLLETKEKPDVRYQLIHNMQKYDVPAKLLVDQLPPNPSGVARQALILALAEYPPEQLDERLRESIVERITERYRNDLDPGVHAAALWMLQQWKVIPPELPTRPDVDPESQTFWPTTEGHTMVAIRGPNRFLKGSPSTEVGRDPIETIREEVIPRSFAISAHEVTIAQFRHSGLEMEYAPEIGPEETCPCNKVSWVDAIRYCRWLSDMERIPEKEMCYPPVHMIDESFVSSDEMLNRTGYRLPTEAEWEFACRAGSSTRWFFGEDDQLLAKYGWWLLNSEERSWPVGRLRPNPLGLFDIYGNLMEWCYDRSSSSAGDQFDTSTDMFGGSDVRLGEPFFRGGSYRAMSRLQRSAKRFSYRAGVHYSILGFRIAKTIRD